MNYVLAGRTIGQVLGRSGGAAAVPWWLAAGVTPVAAYAPKGAASLAASYTNLANPGTYNAAPGVAPTFDTATGWTFAAALSQYLTTGIVPGAGWMAIVKFASASGTNPYLFGANGANRYFMISPVVGSVVRYQSGVTVGNQKDVSPALVSGTLAIAGQYGYRNGVQDASGMAAAYADAAAIYIGCRNANGTASNFLSGQISSFWIYNATLSSANVAIQAAAMP